MLPRPRFTLVIPAHNEEAFLPRLLDSIDRARSAYRNGRDAVEVVVADNASTDRTAEVARGHGCRLVAVEKRIIGAVRNGGAQAAHGEVLAFVDADAQLDPETFNEIERALADGSVIGGATGIRFERQSLGLVCTYALLVLAALCVRGPRTVRPLSVDSGVLFCRRRDFLEAGAFREDMLFAEDAMFLRALRRVGRRRGQRLVSGTNAKTVFSTRKFNEYGDWHYFLLPVRIAWAVLTGRAGWARAYWYDR